MASFPRPSAPPTCSVSCESTVIRGVVEGEGLVRMVQALELLEMFPEKNL